MISKNAFFLVEKAEENLYTGDDVVLHIVIDEKKYFIEQDSFIYEVGHTLEHFSNISNYLETKSDDLGWECFKHQLELNKDINSRELDEFDHYCAFRANETIVLFFKKNDKFYCQIVKNGSEKYEKLYLQEIWEETLNAWKNIL